MTRDEFIDGYMARSGIDPEFRTEDGFVVVGSRRVAVPCACGDEACSGWAMVSPDDVDEYLDRYGA